MDVQLHILVLHNNPDVVVSALRVAEINAEIKCITTESAFLAFFQAPQAPTESCLVIAGLGPDEPLDALRALHLLRKHKIRFPLIVMAGPVGEMAAAACIQRGAAAFVPQNSSPKTLRREVAKALRTRNRLWRKAKARQEHVATLARLAEEAETAEREQRALVEALQSIANAFNSTLSTDLVMVRILENVGRTMPHEAVNIMMLENGRLRATHWRDYPADAAEVFRTVTFPLAMFPRLQNIFQTGRGNIDPPVVDPLEPIDLSPFKWVQSIASAPIKPHGQVIGFLSVDSMHPGSYKPLHLERLQIFADQAAIAFENAHLYDALRHEAQKLQQHVDQRTVELRRTKERVEAILNSSSDAITVTLIDGTIQHTNPAFSILFGYDSMDAFGKQLVSLVQPEQGGDFASAIHAAAAGNVAVRLEVVAQRRDGTTFDADVVLSPIRERDDPLTEIVCSIRDISARKKAEAGLRAALERERELGELKSRFVSMVSHEFRTPLTMILLASDTLGTYSNQMTEERRQEQIKRINNSVRHMTSLLEDVLTFSRAEAGKLEFRPIEIALEHFCQEIVDEARVTFAAGREIIFQVKTHPLPFKADLKLLRQILSNLLSNAVKYSMPETSVSFHLDHTDHAAVFRVQDAGIGIPPEAQHRLFEAFHRARNVGNISGTGLGLAIVKRAVELHQGTITFETKLGVGTTFTVTIPNLRENQ